MTSTMLLSLLAVLFNTGWSFNGCNPADDSTHRAEYFSFIAKATWTGQGITPVMKDFDDSGWQKVTLPHDWVVDLPYSGEASHSHGYKMVGWKYPENNIGWYRKRFNVPAEYKGKRVLIEFDGIYRNSEVYCNGCYLGGRSDGYLQQVYDLTEYLDYGAENVLAVRCDASLEEGWYYEGAGIYRNVHLHVTPQSAALPHGVQTYQSYADGVYTLKIATATTVPGAKVENTLRDAEGRTVASGGLMRISDAHEWSVSDPYLYTLETVVDGADTTITKIGLRRLAFGVENGFELNGEKLLLKGCNLHQDHAGVGSGIPDELWRYRLTQLKKYGFNAIRSSHNPATPALLDLCDELGFVVIDENREFGANDRQLSRLRDMIERDINHPSVILWSIGNEEWALEWDPKGASIAKKMCDFAHTVDPTRLCTYGNCSGNTLVKSLDIFGYNYIVQNRVDDNHRDFPEMTIVGTEETSGAGTRGKYVTTPEEGWMEPLNRRDTLGVVNAIERGWRFYHENRWTCGLFYWTGFDYRGESNPMVWPATGSQFGILDYCGFPKDEAFYLKSWWTSEPVIHVCGEARGQVWVYSNCPEVELFQGRRSLGRKKMPTDGYLAWTVKDNGQPFTAKGRYNGVRISDIWPSVPASTTYVLSKAELLPDGEDISVLDIDSPASELTVSVEGAEIIGWGNGNPGFKEKERDLASPASLTVKPFSGKCQVILRSIEGCSTPLRVSVQ